MHRACNIVAGEQTSLYEPTGFLMAQVGGMDRRGLELSLAMD